MSLAVTFCFCNISAIFLLALPTLRFPVVLSQYRKLLSLHTLPGRSHHTPWSLPVIFSSTAAPPTLGARKRYCSMEPSQTRCGNCSCPSCVRPFRRKRIPSQRRACPFFYNNAIQLVRFSASHGSRVIPGAGREAQSSGSVERLNLNRVVGARAVRIRKTVAHYVLTPDVSLFLA
jgi:hypothetical protein